MYKVIKNHTKLYKHRKTKLFLVMSYLFRGNSYGWPLGLVSTLNPLARGGDTECKVENNVSDYTFYK